MIPPQTPVTPPRYRFRPRSDRYTMPTLPVGDRPERSEPYDGGDWASYEDNPRNESLWARFRRAWSE